MKAWVYHRYGGPEVLGFEEVETPVPAAGEIAIRIRATGLNAADWHIMVAGKGNRPDLETLATLIDAGEVTPVIDRTYPLSEVPEAMRYQEEGHPKGKVVIDHEEGDA